MLRNKILPAIFIFASAFATFSCNSDDTQSPDFDRTQLLQNLADSLIKPAYTDLNNQLAVLESKSTSFTQNPNSQTLVEAQTAWENAFEAWQYANAYNFGPAGEEGIKKILADEIGVFPINTSQLENNVSASKHSFNDFSRDSRGLQGIEYLLFDLSDNQQNIVAKYSDTARRSHLIAMIKHTKKQVNDVSNAWSTYRNSFIENNGTDAGSSASLFFNSFVQSYELLKNFKVSHPLGKRAGQTQTEPTKVEAYYSGKSAKMLKIHFTALENIWHGKSKKGTDGVGFKDYLLKVEGGTGLVASTETQIATIKNIFAQIPNDTRLSTQVTSNTANLELLNTELQKNTRFFKSDMSSLLGIAISYTSGDGD
jgi:predicted lipoprotein